MVVFTIRKTKRHCPNRAFRGAHRRRSLSQDPRARRTVHTAISFYNTCRDSARRQARRAQRCLLHCARPARPSCFSGGGGIAYVLQPTFGYLLGFCAGAFVTGQIAHRVSAPSVKRLLAANFAGLVLVYCFGMAYYWAIYQFYIERASASGHCFSTASCSRGSRRHCTLHCRGAAWQTADTHIAERKGMKMDVIKIFAAARPGRGTARTNGRARAV